MLSTPLEVALKRDRLLVLGGLVIVSALAWGYLFQQAHGMQAMNVDGMNMSGMDMGPVDSHSIFVVDASGHIRWKELAPDTMHVPVDDVISALKQA